MMGRPKVNSIRSTTKPLKRNRCSANSISIKCTVHSTVPLYKRPRWRGSEASKCHHQTVGIETATNNGNQSPKVVRTYYETKEPRQRSHIVWKETVQDHDGLVKIAGPSCCPQKPSKDGVECVSRTLTSMSQKRDELYNKCGVDYDEVRVDSGTSRAKRACLASDTPLTS